MSVTKTGGSLDQGWLWPWETQKHSCNLSKWNPSWWQRYEAMRALAFKLHHYSQDSDLESMCCLNIQILALVSFGGFQEWGTELTGLSCHQQTSPMERVKLRGRTPYGINQGAFWPPGAGKDKVPVSFKYPYCLCSHPKDERNRLGLEGTETYEPHEVFSAKASRSYNEQLHFLFLQGWRQMRVGIRPGRRIVWKQKYSLFNSYMNRRCLELKGR